MIQWLRIRLPVQGMRVQSLGEELKMPHAIGQLSLCATTREACVLQLLSLCTLELKRHNQRAGTWQRRPRAPQNLKNNK